MKKFQHKELKPSIYLKTMQQKKEEDIYKIQSQLSLWYGYVTSYSNAIRHMFLSTYVVQCNDLKPLSNSPQTYNLSYHLISYSMAFKKGLCLLKFTKYSKLNLTYAMFDFPMYQSTEDDQVLQKCTFHACVSFCRHIIHYRIDV